MMFISEKERNGATLVLDYDHENGHVGMMNFFSSSDTKSISRGESISSVGDDIFYSITDANNKLNVITNLLSIKQEISLFQMDIKLSHTYSESQNPKDFTFMFWQDVAGFAGLGDLTKSHPKTIAALAKPNASLTRLSTIATSKNFSQDRALQASLDLQTEFVISNFITGKFKFGGMYQKRDRSYDINYAHGGNHWLGGGAIEQILSVYPKMETYGSSVTITDFLDDSYSYGNFLNGDYPISYPMNIDFTRNILRIVKVGSADEGYDANVYGSLIHDYNGSEYKSAAYAMGTFNIGEYITVLPGVRYQNLTTSYFANRGKIVPGGFQRKDTTVTTPHGYWLPMLHLRYKPLPWFQIHFAYTNTLNYPDYNTIIPRYDIGTSSISYNNYLLKPATSENLDLVFSFYNNEIGLFAINAFKKNIDNLIFASRTFLTDLSEYPDLPQGGNQLYSFSTFINNPIPIDLWGIEADWQTHFWYLPEPFSGIVFNINYTHIFSEASYPRSVLNVEYLPDGTFTRTVIDTFYTTRMLNQPNDILNFALGFDYGGFSGRLSMLYQDNIFKRPDFWMQNRVNSDTYIRWDLSLKQELPWYGIIVFLNFNNITGEDDIDLNQKNSFPASRERYGMTGDLGLRLEL